LAKKGFISKILKNHQEVENGDILILLSCEKKFTNLSKNKNNLVIHESDLPKGKGWSPLTYQVLEGKNKIPITLFEADKSFDGGKIYFKKFIDLKGDELVDELREKQAQMTFYLIDKFLKERSDINGAKQIGKETFYQRRNPSHSELDINKSILENFNLLRVVDNERYPAYFTYKNHKYILKISKDG
jgi:methionyl-tRNA formyltransferase